MQEYNGMPVEHLGDGVYALYDYTGIWLHANHHANPTDKVYIEPQILEALNRFSERMKLLREEKLTGKEKEKEIRCPKCYRLTGIKEVRKKNYDKSSPT